MIRKLTVSVLVGLVLRVIPAYASPVPFFVGQGPAQPFRCFRRRPRRFLSGVDLECDGKRLCADFPASQFRRALSLEKPGAPRFVSSDVLARLERSGGWSGWLDALLGRAGRGACPAVLRRMDPGAALEIRSGYQQQQPFSRTRSLTPSEARSWSGAKPWPKAVPSY